MFTLYKTVLYHKSLSLTVKFGQNKNKFDNIKVRMNPLTEPRTSLPNTQFSVEILFLSYKIIYIYIYIFFFFFSLGNSVLTMLMID